MECVQCFWRVLTVCVCACCMLVTPSMAQDRPHLDLEVGTEFPVSIAASMVMTYPNGLRLSTGLGYLPNTYVEVINEVVQSFPYSYDDATGDLIEETLKDSLIWRLHAGWQSRLGVYVETGYRLTALGGGTSSEALLAGITNWEGTGEFSGSSGYDVSSVLHMVDLEIGWTTTIDDRWTFRTALGGAATVAASSNVSAQSTSTGRIRQGLVQEFESLSEKYLVDTYTEYVFTPVLTVALGYRLR